MTTIIGGGFPGYDAAATAAAGLRARVATLTAQVSSGQKAESYAGLGAEARLAIDLRAERAQRQVLAEAAKRGAAFGQAAQASLQGIADAASGVLAHAGRILANGLPTADARTVAMTAEEARGALRTIVGLLGERYAGEAIFGGADPQGAPIVAPGDFEATGLFTGTRAAVQGLAPGNGQAVLDQTRALAESNDPGVSPFRGFAAEAAQGLAPDSVRAVPVGGGETIGIGLFAYRNTAVASSGETTGSWARDLLRGLSVIANLGPAQVAQGADYDTLARGAIGALKAGFEGLAQEQGSLGTRQARLDAAATRNTEAATQLEAQLGKVEQVDLAEAITRLQATQTQLQASYQSLALLKDLSLVNLLR